MIRPLVAVALLLTLLPAPARALPMLAVCRDFPNQAAAQAAYRADPAGNRNLDRDLDGVACEANRALKNVEPVCRALTASLPACQPAEPEQAVPDPSG